MALLRALLFAGGAFLLVLALATAVRVQTTRIRKRPQPVRIVGGVAIWGAVELLAGGVLLTAAIFAR